MNYSKNNNNNNNHCSQGGLVRYGSAPSTAFDNALESSSSANRESYEPSFIAPLQLTHNFNGSPSSSSSSPLVRHNSLPAGFLNDYLPRADTAGLSISRGIGRNYNSKGIADDKQGMSRMSSRLSFTRSKESLSRISEEIENKANSDNRDNNGKPRSSSCSNNTGASSFMTMGLWDDNPSLTFSVSPTQQPKTSITMDNMESQFQFGMGQGAIEFTRRDKLVNIPRDSVPCKIRAKRGCATHPRSIAERERRTRISGKLKKLQDLVPNMDKQTCYADMLDLAVQHIKTLQVQVQKLNDDLDGCKCGCKKTTTL